MGNGPSNHIARQGQRKRLELKSPGIILEALALKSQIHQWSSDVKTGGQPGSPSCPLIGQVARSGSSAEVRPLSNWSLPKACSQGRTRSECSDSEIAGLRYRDAPSRRLSFPLHLPLPPEQQPPGSPSGLFIPKQQRWLILRDPFPTPRVAGKSGFSDRSPSHLDT